MTPTERLLLLLLADRAQLAHLDMRGHTDNARRIMEARHALDAEAVAEHSETAEHTLTAMQGRLERLEALVLALWPAGYVACAEVERLREAVAAGCGATPVVGALRPEVASPLQHPPHAPYS